MKKVIVGMSGGVDSAVAAILLLEQGYDVEALFMRNWDSNINNDYLGNPNLNNYICPQEEDYNDAVEVCKHLNIKLHRINFVKEYWDNVFTYFLDELKKGRTPNPDIMCNKYIKFDVFKEEAKKLGAEFVATGHYAKLKDGKLCKPKDLDKDQTYFLSQTSIDKFSNVLFPLEDILKTDVRIIAEKNNLPVSHKKDSTGICFIGERDFRKFLKNYFPVEKGNIVDIELNKVIGTHEGLMNYTIGQRKGLKIGGNEKSIYVVGKNLKDNILYIAKGDDNEYLLSDEALVEEMNFLSTDIPTKCYAKFRYRQKDQEVEIKILDDKHITVKYPQKIKSITPGQACVLYSEEGICLGGGIISKVKKDEKELWYL